LKKSFWLGLSPATEATLATSNNFYPITFERWFFEQVSHFPSLYQATLGADPSAPIDQSQESHISP
jgi:hypothetical protein